MRFSHPVLLRQHSVLSAASVSVFTFCRVSLPRVARLKQGYLLVIVPFGWAWLGGFLVIAGPAQEAVVIRCLAWLGLESFRWPHPCGGGGLGAGSWAGFSPGGLSSTVSCPRLPYLATGVFPERRREGCKTPWGPRSGPHTVSLCCVLVVKISHKASQTQGVGNRPLSLNGTGCKILWPCFSSLLPSTPCHDVPSERSSWGAKLNQCCGSSEPEIRLPGAPCDHWQCFSS